MRIYPLLKCAMCKMETQTQHVEGRQKRHDLFNVIRKIRIIRKATKSYEIARQHCCEVIKAMKSHTRRGM